jgi:teichuronic acid exporter
MSDNLKQKTINALTWTTIDRFGQQAVQFIIGLILARLLSPDDYGLLGMVMIFATLSFVLIESGFGQALIRKKDATELDFNTVFYFNIFISALLYVILFFSAPFIASYFNQPQLTLIGRIIFIAILFNAFYLVSFTKKVKEMDFKSVAKVNLFATILSGFCGVVLAILRFGVWALVTQQVSFHFFRMIAYQYFGKWKPKLLFSFSVIREFWSFSIHILGTSLLNVVFNNLYVLILGKYYQKKDVGYYTQANKLSETFNFSFQQILLGGTYSMFSQIQDDDDRFRRILREITKKASIVSIPVMLVFIAVAKPFVFVLLSAKWLPSAPYFQLLCFASLFTPFYGLNISALNARGLSRQTFFIETAKKGLILISVLISFNYGVVTMLWGYVIACFVSYLISVVYIKRDIQHYIKNQITDLFSGLSIGILIAALAFSLSFFITNYHLLLFAQLILIVGIYVFAVKKVQPQLYNQVVGFIEQKVGMLKRKSS